MQINTQPLIDLGHGECVALTPIARESSEHCRLSTTIPLLYPPPPSSRFHISTAPLDDLQPFLRPVHVKSIDDKVLNPMQLRQSSHGRNLQSEYYFELPFQLCDPFIAKSTRVGGVKPKHQKKPVLKTMRTPNIEMMAQAPQSWGVVLPNRTQYITRDT